MRLFIAAEIPGDVREALWRAVDPLRESFPRIRWVPAENLHVTLKFLGNTREDQRVFAEDRMSVVAASSAPFEITLEGVGGFPSGRRAKTIWVGLGDPSGSLAALAEALEEQLAPEFEPQERAYKPHLTVARASRPVGLLDALPAVSLPTTPFTVDHLALYRSHLHPDGPTYELEEQAPLGA